MAPAAPQAASANAEHGSCILSRLLLHIMVQTSTLGVVQGTHWQSWMNEMGIELQVEGNDSSDMRTTLEVQRHLKTCLMEPAHLTCLLLMGGTVQGLTRALQRLGPQDSKGPTGLSGTTGTGRGTTTDDSVTLHWRQRFNGLSTLFVNCRPLSWVS